MRSTRPAALWLLSFGTCGALAACASLSGLDQIEESYCAPDGCDTDASVTTLDATPASPPPDAGSPALPDVQTDPPDVTRPTLPDASRVADAARADASGDAAQEPDASPFTPADAGTDAARRADASPELDSSAPPDGSDAGCGTPYFQDSFGSDASAWTLGTNWAIASECASPPAPQKGSPDPTTDHTASTGSGALAAFLCGNNPTGQTLPAAYATSPAVDVSGAKSLQLGFWRWLNTDAADWMASTVDVYDGSAWVNVYTNPSGAGNLVTDAAWTHVTIDVTAHKNPAFQVRFGYAIVKTGAYSMSAWNLDDVTLGEATCP